MSTLDLAGLPASSEIEAFGRLNNEETLFTMITPFGSESDAQVQTTLKTCKVDCCRLERPNVEASAECRSPASCVVVLDRVLFERVSQLDGPYRLPEKKQHPQWQYWIFVEHLEMMSGVVFSCLVDPFCWLHPLLHSKLYHSPRHPLHLRPSLPKPLTPSKVWECAFPESGGSFCRGSSREDSCLYFSPLSCNLYRK